MLESGLHVPEISCPRHTLFPDTHLHPTHTCIRHTLVSDTHLHPTHTCIRHTLAPETHFKIFSKEFKKIQNFLLIQNTFFPILSKCVTKVPQQPLRLRWCRKWGAIVIVGDNLPPLVRNRVIWSAKYGLFIKWYTYEVFLRDRRRQNLLAGCLA